MKTLEHGSARTVARMVALGTLRRASLVSRHGVFCVGRATKIIVRGDLRDEVEIPSAIQVRIEERDRDGSEPLGTNNCKQYYKRALRSWTL